MIQNYFSLAFRNLLKYRTFAGLNIIGLGISLGCSILIFMLVRHHLGFDAFHRKADRTALIGTESKLETSQKSGDVPYPMGDALRREYAFLEKTAMISNRSQSLITIAQEGSAPVKFMEAGARAFTEPELFEIFDFPLTQGNLKDFYQPNTALLTERLAQKYYGTTDVLGKSFKVNNRLEYRIVGVLKDLPENTDIRNELFTSWATLKADSLSIRMLNNWGGIHGGTQCFVSFREGSSTADLEAAFAGFREKYYHPEVREFHYHALPLKAAHFDRDYGRGVPEKMIWALALIGFFLLVTACVNFINMATAQALNRAREVGVRKSMGGTRRQLFWQFMSETGAIVALSSLIGLLMARAGLPYLNDLAETNLRFNLLEDYILYGFLAVTAIFVTFLAGAYPGLALSGFKPVESLKGKAGERQIGGFSLRRLLVGSQFALSQALIIAAVVVTAQIEYARNADLGFQKDGIVTVSLPAPDARKKSALKQQLEQISGIEKVSICMQPPASDGNWNTSLRLQGKAQDEPWSVNFKFIDTEYLDVFNLKMLAGRNLQASDTIREIIVNEEVVRKLGFNNPQEILGRQLEVDHQPFPVIGVVKNFHNHSFKENIQPQIFASDISNYDVAAVKLNLQDLKSTLSAVEKTWTEIYPEYVFEYEFMDARIARFYEEESVILMLVRFFAGIAVFIGCLGLYGLSAFMVARKTKEIGIRKTLGSSLSGILWLFGKEYLRLIIVAFAVSAPMAWLMMNGWLKDYIYRISIGAGIFGVSLGITVLVALITVGGQSLRAALINPSKSLRSE